MFPIEDLMKTNDTGDIVDNNTGTNNRLSRWHHNSSRIIRVSRASGGKDRHSKVWTSKGARDRRVRLSVSTALQFYDLQDRLGYDQPSKAIEWLIKAAEESISELPSLNTSNFPMFDGGGGEEEPNQTGTGLGVSKSACCSSNSDTSKNSSGLSLSRSELRDKARERARERTAKERDHSTTSFTDLLNSGSDPVNVNRDWMVQAQTQAPSSSSPMEYFSSGLILGSSSHYHHQQHQEFAFVPDHLISPVGSTGGGGFNLDFNMSSNSSVVSGTGATVVSGGGEYNGFNRGTLQSNSSNNHHQNHNQNQSFLANLQSGGGGGGGGGAQFLFGALPVENHHPNHNHQFQLYYENNKGKGKN